MITFHTTGSIFDCGADAVVIPVNCVGVAGKGVALEAKKKWPQWDIYYRANCDKRLYAGGLLILDRSELRQGLNLPHPSPSYILAAATKNHWRSKSTALDVGQCLARIRAWCLRVQPSAIAIPALGCGLGGLPWSTVKPMVERTFDMSPYKGDLTLSTRVMVFEPQ